MTNPIRISILALALVLGASAAHSFGARASFHHHDVGSTVGQVGDPDPADCPFCGGNPMLHVRKMFEMQRVTMGLATQLLR